MSNHFQNAFRTLINRLASTVGLEVVSNRRLGNCPVKDLGHFFARTEYCPSVIYDVGANVGRTSILLDSIFFPKVIYSIEPFEATYTQLVQNTRKLQRIKPVHVALGDRIESRFCSTSTNSELNSIRHASPSDASIIETISVTTLDQHAVENLVDCISILKTDTEGFDLQVLQGGASLLGRTAIHSIICEVGFDRNDTRHTRFCELHRFLSDYGFCLYSISDQRLSENNSHLDYANAVYLSQHLISMHDKRRYAN